MPTIVIGADVCPIERNRPLFEQGDANALFNDLLPEFNEADLLVANLECPLIEAPTPIVKSGPVFGESSACINGIKAAGFDVLCLANNHILDHGADGLRHTLQVVGDAGISTVGAGESLEAARKVLVREVDGLRIGFLAMAEHEYSVATSTTGGANPLDLASFVRSVKQNENRYDYLVVLLHGGHEHYPLPSPRVRDTCRFMAEMGADVVVVQHPHRLCGYEKYQGAHLVYGQGALILDEKIFRNLKPFHQGLLVKLTLSNDLTSAVQFVPFTQADPEPGARRMEEGRAVEVLRAFDSVSQAVQDDPLIEEQWRSFCQEQKHGYISSLLGHGRLLDKLNSRGFVSRWLYRRRGIRGALHVTSCETHREILETLFREDLY